MSFKKWAPAKLITLQYLMIKTLINRWLKKLQYKILLNTKGMHAAQSSNEGVLVNDDDDNTDDDDDDDNKYEGRIWLLQPPSGHKNLFTLVGWH